jgi:serine/threonine-protein kinase SRK2
MALQYTSCGSRGVESAPVLHHPHIIQFREVFLTADHLALVSEFAAGGDLADYIDRHQAIYKKASMTESNALWLFHQLVTGVNFCHQVSIIKM